MTKGKHLPKRRGLLTKLSEAIKYIGSPPGICATCGEYFPGRLYFEVVHVDKCRRNKL